MGRTASREESRGGGIIGRDGRNEGKRQGGGKEKGGKGG